MQPGLQLDLAPQLRLVVTPAMKQTLQILQYSALELGEFLSEQLRQNPLVELEDRNRADRIQPQDDQELLWERMAIDHRSLVEKLEIQLVGFSLTTLQEKVCRYLIGSLDERGYLDIEQEEVLSRFPIKEKDWEICLRVLHSLEPAGIGARSLAECLTIQLQRKQSDPLAIQLAKHYLKELAMEQWDILQAELKVDRQQLEKALAEIRQCDPEPARQLQPAASIYRIPDVIVEKTVDGFSIRYNDNGLPNIRIHPEYQQLYHRDQEAYRYFRPWMRAARLLLKGLAQRRETMVRVTQAILDYQRDFLHHGVQAIKPLTLRQVAVKCGLHESTISRATQGKFLQTPHGLFPFRFFFPAGVPDRSGAGVSVHQVKQLIHQMIQRESAQAPLSDQRIAQILRDKKGLRISRRTVNKYRQELGIPSSVERKRKATQLWRDSV